MLTNGDVTIINKVYDPSTRLYSYRKTLIEDVYFELSDGVRQMATGATSEDKALVIIYKSNKATADYKKPKEFEKAAAGWTLRPEDYFVLGEVEGEITSIQTLEDTLDDVYKITNVDEFTAGPLLHHWEVRGK